jgi:hypothetical protein
MRSNRVLGAVALAAMIGVTACERRDETQVEIRDPATTPAPITTPPATTAPGTAPGTMPGDTMMMNDTLGMGTGTTGTGTGGY